MEKEHGFWLRNKEGIIVGLLTSFVFLFIQPVLLKTGDYIITWLTNISEDYASNFYRNLPIDRTKILVSIANINTILAGLFILAFWFDFIHFKGFINTKNIEAIVIRVVRAKKTEEINPDPSLYGTLHHSKGDAINKYMFFALSITYFIVTFTYMYSQSYQDKLSSINLIFDDKLIVIKPYIPDKEYDKFRSQWRLIKTKKDYEKIDSTLNTIMKQNNLKFDY